MSKVVQEGWVDYVELPASSIEDTKRFYAGIFGWTFTDYGPEYTCFSDGRLSGGFYAADYVRTGGPLIVIYTSQLEAMAEKVESAGGTIVRKIFEFPGGRRFHFTDPSGNELGLWSDK